MKIKEAATPNEKLALQFHKIENLTHRLHRVDRRNAAIDKADKVSIHRGQGRVLALLKAEGSLCLTDLVEKLDIRPSSASELVTKLEQSGYVTREAGKEDRRVSFVTITEAGSACLNATAKINAAYFDKMFSALSDEEVSQLSALLDKLVSSLKEKGEAKGIKIGDSSRRRKTRHSHSHI